MFAGIESIDSHRIMQVKWRGNDHRIYIFVFKQLFIIGISLRPISFLQSILQMFRYDITTSYDLHTTNIFNKNGKASTPGTGANNSYTDYIIIKK